MKNTIKNKKNNIKIEAKTIKDSVKVGTHAGNV
jgi:hypothetical protein